MKIGTPRYRGASPARTCPAPYEGVRRTCPDRRGLQADVRSPATRQVPSVGAGTWTRQPSTAHLGRKAREGEAISSRPRASDGRSASPPFTWVSLGAGGVASTYVGPLAGPSVQLAPFQIRTCVSFSKTSQGNPPEKLCRRQWLDSLSRFHRGHGLGLSPRDRPFDGRRLGAVRGTRRPGVRT